ncbi:flagellar basal body rod protein FlgF [Imbroritus primus]|uniref:Flagellar basal body rod protein FlgF n=1 Tax=Imbroritus primus TaxID=3058603 RepID=A0ACD3SW75_9BURK|nr:flagellar basal body rod protein FlgF [Burkholderiaceae bacterium PBA]
MDKSIYLVMNRARHLFDQQASTANNLANAGTNGFKGQVDAAQTVRLLGEGSETRQFAMAATIGTDLRAGQIQTTGRSLDVAVSGPGWLAVQTPTGEEAYTRDGGMQLAADGTLETRSGLALVGVGGPIVIPPETQVQFAADGTITAVSNDSAVRPVVLGQLKLVNIEPVELERRPDGLFRQRNGEPADADETVRIAGGALEGSNVNPTEALVQMIDVSRQFEMQMKMLRDNDSSAQRANELLRHS